MSNLEKNSNQKELYENILSKTKDINLIQKYIKDVIEIRGFSKQSPQENMLLLTEEVGELAKAIRKETTTMGYDTEKLYNYDTVESEVADVFIVLTNICNSLNINLYDAIVNKENKNINRDWKKK